MLTWIVTVHGVEISVLSPFVTVILKDYHIDKTCCTKQHLLISTTTVNPSQGFSVKETYELI
ncbi:hypothetical protein HMPREF9104_01049 [Lentilactobacillus kisonensis F0435]|uniref:Uncharacterized protein n=1 Tax=Lentilactobacillus kisonensis F0435 TaxID=797516 RepID=H1LEM3_9LACO|nr:hypothetical protein HMPREF9104_01049 [Lentilactobacillus kisonensis F0435]